MKKHRLELALGFLFTALFVARPRAWQRCC